MDTSSTLPQTILDRFLKYVRIHTTSTRNSDRTPSTPGQWDLARLLEGELKELGIGDVALTDRCYLIARIPGADPEAPWIGLMAHVDTTEECPGENVKPLVHEDYGGGEIVLPAGLTISPETSPMLRRYVGETIITSSGDTLLGADDKAGVAAVMSLAAHLTATPRERRCNVEVIFTPDEETGRGMDRFPKESLKSSVCYTVDGGEEGAIEAECFTAYGAQVQFDGVVIHPGQARGRLTNAITMAERFLAMIPGAERPESTDGRYGFFYPMAIHGDVGHAEVELLLRDFETEGMERRLALIEEAARVVERAFPEGQVTVTTRKQYLNMRESIERRPESVGLLARAIRETGIEPEFHAIRGGTDGARLSEMGIPTPNLFSGAQNMHSPTEWVALPAMVRSTQTLVNLCRLWADPPAVTEARGHYSPGASST